MNYSNSHHFELEDLLVQIQNEKGELQSNLHSETRVPKDS